MPVSVDLPSSAPTRFSKKPLMDSFAAFGLLLHAKLTPPNESCLPHTTPYPRVLSWVIVVKGRYRLV